jgi:cell division transport system permease protein
MLANLKRERLLVITNIVVMSISFLVLGIFTSVIFLSQSMLKYLENQAQLMVFFKDEFVEEKILKYKTELEKDERVLSISYVSKEDAFNIFTEANKDEPILLESLSSDILPASLEIRTKDVRDLAPMAESISKAEGVEEVKFFEDVIDRFRSISLVVHIVGFVLVGLLLLVSYSIVLATLRMTISAKGKELEIQRLVGASDAFIKRPLLVQGIFFGIASALVSSIVLITVSFILSSSGLYSNLNVPFIPGAKTSLGVFSLFDSLLILISGGVLGYFGSLSAVKRYLKI